MLLPISIYVTAVSGKEKENGLFHRLRKRIYIYMALTALANGLFMAPMQAHAASGDGLVVYGEGTVTTPRYRTYTPTSFGTESNAQTANATIRWVAMKTKPGATERIMGTLSSAASNNLTIQRWNGSSWVSPVEWQDTNSNSTYHGFDIAYENLTGRVMVVYADGTSTPKYRIWNGSTWTSEASITLSTSIGTIYKVRLTG